MIRGCRDCTGPGATKRGCDCRICDRCLAEHGKVCPTSQRLRAMTPADVRAWKAANEPEQTLTTEVVAALNALNDIEFAWQGKKGGIRAHDLAPGLPDVLAYARHDARLIGVETKRNHKAGCGCPSCEAQRDWGVRLEANGGVYVPDVRNVQQAVDGVRLGLARRRAVLPEVAAS